MLSQMCGGLDGAQAHLAMALRPTGARGVVTNEATGIAALVPRLQSVQPTLMGLAATGGDHRAVGAARAAAATPGAAAGRAAPPRKRGAAPAGRHGGASRRAPSTRGAPR
jgi:hypothetical protein